MRRREALAIFALAVGAVAFAAQSRILGWTAIALGALVIILTLALDDVTR